MTKDHGPSIKDDDTYETLRDKGMSREKAARIANAKAAGDKPSETGGENPPYEEWKRDDLYKRAQEIGLQGRAGMTKKQLINALRNH